MKTLRGGRTSRDPPQGPHYRDEVEGPSPVQDKVPRCELGGLQPRTRSTRRCDGVVVRGGDRWLDAPPERPAGWAAALLGSRHRGRPDPATPLPSPAAPSRRVPARPVRDDAPRPLRPRLYDALPAQSASEAPSATGPDCSAPGFLDSGLQVITSTLPRPARRNRVALGLDSDSRTSPASTARCTSVETRARRGGVPRSFRSSAPTRDSPLPCG